MIKKIAFSLFLAATSAAFATNYTGNGATGFGGTLGNGSLTLTQSGTTINGTFTEGGAFNDGLVIYIDSAAGGATTISQAAGFTDAADSNRHAITGVDGNNAARAINLPIGADFAIALSPAQGTFGGLWSLSNGANLPFVTSVNLLPLTAGGPVYTFSFDLSNIGLTPGQSFNFVTTYLNGSNGFLSNETLNGTTGLGATNVGDADATLSGFQTFSTAAVPEPATVLLVGPALLGGMFFVRRRRA
jgi:PEP-CTERM motif